VKRRTLEATGVKNPRRKPTDRTPGRGLERSKQVNFRVTPEELEWLRERAADYGAKIRRPVSVSEYVRAVAVGVEGGPARVSLVLDEEVKRFVLDEEVKRFRNG
jgi:hypothetical protein